MKRYNPQELEPKWQKIWAESGIYKTDMSRVSDKFYTIPMLPYPSGDLHIGHWYNYVGADSVARWRRLLGQNVFTALGFDAFGLPAENAAIKRGLQPAKWTRGNIKSMKEQIAKIGASYDWDHSLITCDPEYYRWNQWLFLKLYEKGLAYRKKAMVNWCPKDQTVLANEQVVGENNVCERCGTPVIQKTLPQWFFKITDYADRLLDDLDEVNWPQRVKTMQENWIGRSRGALIKFAVEDSKENFIEVFTTRPDTIYGATFMVVAPEHKILNKLSISKEVEKYIEQAKRKTELERKAGEKDKTGVFSGLYAINPANKKKIPIWVADYVLMSYGTGAIMAVPAHDERDHEFATKFDLPIEPVIIQDFGEPLPDEHYVEGVVVIPYDPKTKKYLALGGWNQGIGLVGGGRESAENLKQCAARELEEEAGIASYEALISLGDPVYSHYHNDLKKINRRSLGQGYLVVTDSQAKTKKPALEAHEKFKAEWMDMADIRAGITKLGGGTQHWLEMTERAERAAADYEAGRIYQPAPYSGEGVLINSDKYDGLSSAEAREKIVTDLSGAGDDEPVFEQTTGSSAVKKGQPFVERQAITAIVKHWSEDKYIGLKWKTVDWETLITGGIEKGQTAEQAAIAEIREETGYQNPKLVRVLGKNHAKFFHVPKNENRFAHFTCLLFELADGEREQVSAKEQKNHEVVWLTPAQMEKFDLPQSHRHIWDQIRKGSGGLARAQTNYRLRDWLISRQRYWGTPIPIIYCDKCGIQPVSESDLPVILPEDVEFELSGQSPLVNRPDFVNTKCPNCGGPAKRETDTMDTFMDSSWYFLRYIDNKNDKAAFDTKLINQWAPVDHYLGGIEHAILHLLYARFMVKFLHDYHGLTFTEPFKRLTNQGIILGPDGQKMSKSRGNVVSPDEQVKSYGADSLRLYMLFMGPYDQGGPYSLGGIAGTRRFLDRVWTLLGEYLESPAEPIADMDEVAITAAVHRAIKKVTNDIEALNFNTAIAGLMSLTNELYKFKVKPGLAQTPAWRFAFDSLVQLLAPMAPHITEELWQALGHESSVHISEWPAWDEALVSDEMVTIAVQVNGKVRGEIVISKSAEAGEVIAMAKEDDKVAKQLAGKKIKKEIYVPGRLVSLVVG
ncbi:MAG TPA: class I tRNA ligase family protein [Candidatus Saccharimonadales bacterium]|nr:class I tRNA ligase family protein [Candidatus Saccharimonadales bacterium]